MLLRRFGFVPIRLPDTKRLFDLVLILVGLPVWLPLILIIALAARVLQGPGVFFAQQRVGRGGRMFRMWKFRTMVPGAEGQLPRLLMEEGRGREWARLTKLVDDPRVTAWGRMLRRFSLDELPQIWNVLCGEMSLVGPRPVPRAEFGARYDAPTARAYCAHRPGMSGLWQVSGRNALSYEERLRLDRRYDRTRSLGGDAVILLRTLGVVLGGRGT
ncbi:probable glucosyltransferase [Pseudooceanicola batsensis HTCC2597]|uniref:Probable glucosyltransferase n=1 Tax=Pseudooceanicola batsensis (strain ATCC BAA-863 / DSM 15984 / KCTC 12145 / HTCC2597) TaxID=252305 RepID=A3TY16_PSEBH|nr:probable glucosyltransferase [Pseudooceanicola batsensis HTCC2597]